MEAPGRRFWYVSRESNTASIHVCRRVGFKRFATGLRGSRFGVHALGELHVQHEAPMIGLEEGYSAKAGVDQASWYRHYYSKVGVARNDLRTSRGALFQTIASERAFIRAFHHISPYSSAMRVLDVGCAGGGSWYQLFRLGVSPSNTLGIDIQRSRLALLHNLYPQCSAVHADAVRIPFANASFDLVYESTMFATLTDDSVRARIADEMLRVCKPDGYLLLVDWKTPKAWDQRYKALTLAELRRLFEVGKTARLVGVFPGALVPPIGRLLSAYAGGLYFLVAVLCPLLVGQVAYLLRKHTGFSND
jgi:SAM-dependent methyltransferase